MALFYDFHLLSLLGLLAGSPLAVALGIDLGGKGVLVGQSDGVNGQDPEGQQHAGGFAVDEGGAEEAHGRAVIHGGVGDVEGEASDNAIHQDAEVVAQEGPGDAEAVGGAEDQHVTHGQEGVAGVGGGIGVEERVRGLVAEGLLVQVVAEEAEGEDGDG